jgi:hypothetical protein
LVSDVWDKSNKMCTEGCLKERHGREKESISGKAR